MATSAMYDIHHFSAILQTNRRMVKQQKGVYLKDNKQEDVIRLQSIFGNCIIIVTIFQSSGTIVESLVFYVQIHACVQWPNDPIQVMAIEIIFCIPAPHKLC